MKVAVVDILVAEVFLSHIFFAIFSFLIINT